MNGRTAISGSETMTTSRKQQQVTRIRALLRTAQRRRVLVVGDVMLDQFIWGGVRRISPEAPVPVVEFQRESFMGGARQCEGI